MEEVTHLVVSQSLHLLLICRLCHFEHQRRLTEPEVLGGDITIQEDVDTWNESLIHELVRAPPPPPQQSAPEVDIRAKRTHLLGR